MIIYKTTNCINGKIYIGYDTKEDLDYYGSGVYYKRAEKKYGKENFRKAIIDSDEDFKALCLKETFWIDFYDARNPNVGYNIHPGGKGGNLTKETKKKISAAKMGKLASEETKQKMRKPKSEEHKRHISECQKGEKAFWYGKNRSDECKQKQRAAVSGLRHPFYGKHLSDEHKQRVREGIQKYWQERRSIQNGA